MRNVLAIAEHVEFVAIQVTKIGRVEAVATFGAQARRAFVGAADHYGEHAGQGWAEITVSAPATANPD